MANTISIWGKKARGSATHLAIQENEEDEWGTAEAGVDGPDDASHHRLDGVDLGAVSAGAALGEAVERHEAHHRARRRDPHELQAPQPRHRLRLVILLLLARRLLVKSKKSKVRSHT
jgi:hypothetical protein